jgi:Branched-chain amino acid ABC-type transport system, permease components
LLVFSGSDRSLTTDVPTFVDVSIGSGSVSVGMHEVVVVVLSAVLMLGTHLVLRYTKLGTAMRAMADNEDLALVTGIPTERVVRTTWLLGGALTGAAGFLIALELGGMSTTLGWDRLLLVFSRHPRRYRLGLRGYRRWSRHRYHDTALGGLAAQ